MCKSSLLIKAVNNTEGIKGGTVPIVTYLLRYESNLEQSTGKGKKIPRGANTGLTYGSSDCAFCHILSMPT